MTSSLPAAETSADESPAGGTAAHNPSDGASGGEEKDPEGHEAPPAPGAGASGKNESSSESVEAVAQADPSRLCLASHEEAQVARLEGNLVAAEDLLVECSAAACSPLIQADCSTWRSEVMASVPTLVVQIRKGGADVSEAELSVDGRVLASKLDGRPVRVDPGRRVVRVTLKSGDFQEQELVLAEGEKARSVRFSFEEPPGSGASRTDTRAETPVVPLARPEFYRPLPVWAPILAGVSVVAAGVGTGVGIHALKLKSQANERCLPLCSAAQESRVATAATVSDVFFGISAVSLASAAVLYLLRPEVERTAVDKNEVATRAGKPSLSFDVRGGADGFYGGAELLY